MKLITCPNCKHIIRKLSKTEEKVLEEVLKGKSNREIAETLFVAEDTIKFHLTCIFKKEMVASRYELQDKYSTTNN